MTLLALQGSFELGIIYAIMALGVFVSFRTLNMPDLSVDGSFVLGAAVSVVMCSNGHPFLGLLIAIVAGCGAGSITALLHTKLKIQPLLAGILTMLALYSLNLKVMSGRANIPLINKTTVFSALEGSANGDYGKLILSSAILLVMLLLLYLFLNTRLGFVLRATGDNEQMVRASGVNTDSMILIGLALSNGFVALSGALIAQYQSYVDVGMGIGMVIIGLASVIIGEVVFGIKSLLRRLIAVILGAVLYRLIIAFALEIGMPATDLKLVSAVIVALAMSMPIIKKRISFVKRKLSNKPYERSEKP
jgi:putative tryptophan/tyrosine transport system permease protein